MAYREVSMVSVREILRLWVRGHPVREIGRLTGTDRKTVTRYVAAARSGGLAQGSSEAAITDELLGCVVEAVRPARAFGHSAAWERLGSERATLEKQIEAGLRLTKMHELLARRSIAVPYRTLHRYCATELGYGRRRATVPVADCEPGSELQIDFGRLGLVADPQSGRRRVCHALIFTAVYSRHLFVYPTHSQGLEALIEGCERAWEFFGGVFAVVIPDNMKAIVTVADAIAPKLSDAFTEYAQSRGFEIDPTRIRAPTDKGRVERSVAYVRDSYFRGESFADITDAQARAVVWCSEHAGLRVHGTTCRRPREVFEAEERPRLAPAPEEPYDLPLYLSCKVHRDHHIQVAYALYSVPGALIGRVVCVRADSSLVRISYQGRLVKVHPRVARGRFSTDAADLPSEKSAYALRDIDRLRRTAAAHGEAIGSYAAHLLDGPLPWTRMRRVYRLLGLVRRFGAARVETACAQALALEVVDVTRIARMLDHALETRAPSAPRPESNVVQLRFARDPCEFRGRQRKDPHDD
jgi:Mu transposase, C-terminal domain